MVLAGGDVVSLTTVLVSLFEDLVEEHETATTIAVAGVDCVEAALGGHATGVAGELSGAGARVLACFNNVAGALFEVHKSATIIGVTEVNLVEAALGGHARLVAAELSGAGARVLTGGDDGFGAS